MEIQKQYSKEAIEYIAKLAEGGMRDAITMMDKCLSYSPNLTLKNVVDALNVVDYKTMIELSDMIISGDQQKVISIIEDLYNSGKDLKQFIKSYMQFLLDCRKWFIGCDWQYIGIPKLNEYEDWMSKVDMKSIAELLSTIIDLIPDIKYSSAVKYDVEASLLRFIDDRSN